MLWLNVCCVFGEGVVCVLFNLYDGDYNCVIVGDEVVVCYDCVCDGE